MKRIHKVAILGAGTMGAESPRILPMQVCLRCCWT